MLEAEQEELAFGIAPDRLTMGSRPLAPVPLACRGLDLSLLRSLSARPNAIEIFGIHFHMPHYGLATELRQELTTRFLTVFRISEQHTSELQSLMRISYSALCLTTKH